MIRIRPARRLIVGSALAASMVLLAPQSAADGTSAGYAGGAPSRQHEYEVPTDATAGPFAAMLLTLAVRDERNGGYHRDAFPHWITQRDGCDTREHVLADEKVAGTITGCEVERGSWLSLYDGAPVADPGALDIDHMVPLAEAWGSGARTWTTARRQRYANDVIYPDALFAVTASTNRSKGDRDPVEWMPPDASARCRYVQAWIAVKWRWRLSVDPIEKKALVGGLSACPKALAPIPHRAR